MKPTIRSIARMCGVSRGTVDRVLNDRPYVSPEVRKKVLRAVQITGYVPPRAAAPSAHAAQIGFLVAQWENDYFRRQTERGIRRAARTLRPGELSLQVETMGSRSDREYIQRIDRLLEAGARGIILNAADNVLLRTKIDDLAAQGVPVVTYNSDLPTSRRVCHVGQDLAKSGQVAAGLLARSLGPHDHILAVTGNLEFLSHRSRVESFCAHAGTLGIGSDRIQLAQCFERYDLTYEAVLNALRQDDRVRGVYMGTESVPACMDAIKKARPRRKIYVVANDLTQPAIRGLKNGMLDFVVEQDFSAQAYEAILVMYALLAHDRPPKTPVRYVSTSIYTKELL
ncbi:MAG: LacI family DNA-binding transcriptional regulator [Butyricicoccus sp.]